jgi:hypothetical protein
LGCEFLDYLIQHLVWRDDPLAVYGNAHVFERLLYLLGGGLPAQLSSKLLHSLVKDLVWRHFDLAAGRRQAHVDERLLDFGGRRCPSQLPHQLLYSFVVDILWCNDLLWLSIIEEFLELRGRRILAIVCRSVLLNKLIHLDLTDVALGHFDNLTLATIKD